MLISKSESIRRRMDDIDYQLVQATRYSLELKSSIDELLLAFAKMNNVEGSFKIAEAFLELHKIRDFIHDNLTILSNAQTSWRFIKIDYTIKDIIFRLLGISRKVIFLEAFSGMIVRSETNANKAKKRASDFFFDSPISDDILKSIGYFQETTSEIHRLVFEIDNLQPHENTDKGKVSKDGEFFIDKNRIKELKAINSKDFDLIKLLKICDEINQNFANENYLSVAILTRALLDHIPPIMQCKIFPEVANNYAGTKSFREAMQHLENSSKKIADAHLHVKVRAKEVLPNKTQVNFANEVDVLLSEIVRLLK
jgi:hypothetical protein